MPYSPIFKGTPAAEDVTAALVDSVLDHLAELDAEVLRLAVWEELTPAEIATVLDLAPSAARTRLMRARRRAQAAYLAAQTTSDEVGA